MKSFIGGKERNSISNFIICLSSRWCSWREAEEEKFSRLPRRGWECVRRGGQMGWKIITKNRRKSPHPEHSMAPLLLGVPRSRQKHTEKDLSNIKVQYSRWCREPTPAWRTRENRCARLLCTIWLLLCAFRRSYSENCEWKSFLSRASPLSLSSARLSHEHRVRRFSVNRKTFLSLSSPLPTPCKSVFNPADDLYFHPSLDCGKCVFVARQGVHNGNDFPPRAKGKPGEWRAGGWSGVGRERDRNKEGKLMIPHIHRDDLAVVVVAGGFKEAFSKLLRN